MLSPKHGDWLTKKKKSGRVNGFMLIKDGIHAALYGTEFDDERLLA
jgi:hypothetical protein